MHKTDREKQEEEEEKWVEIDEKGGVFVVAGRRETKVHSIYTNHQLLSHIKEFSFHPPSLHALCHPLL